MSLRIQSAASFRVGSLHGPKTPPGQRPVLSLITALEPAETEALALQSTDALVFFLESWQTLRFHRRYCTREVMCTRADEAAYQEHSTQGTVKGWRIWPL